MFTLVFWKAAGERAVKTFAQTLLALIGTGAVGITHLDWHTDLGVSCTAALASLLTSLTSLSPIVPSLPGTVKQPEPAPSSVVINAPATAAPYSPSQVTHGIVPGSALGQKVAAILNESVAPITATDPAPVVPDTQPAPALSVTPPEGPVAPATVTPVYEAPAPAPVEAAQVPVEGVPAVPAAPAPTLAPAPSA